MFQFKQFLVKQDKCGMKVCTDACILGAFAALKKGKKILDIGTGTGLLALMIAQKITKAEIEAVEIDHSAYLQAKENIQASPFASQIRIYNDSIQYFVKQHASKKYDLIVSNPPFFENHLASSKSQKHIALHNNLLSNEDLLLSVKILLAEKGEFMVLLPEYQSQILAAKALDFGLYLNQKLIIFNQPDKPVFRIIQTFSKEEKAIEETSLLIKNEQNEYTSEFESLLKDYYLIF